MVVISGPEAAAGSTPTFLKKIGVMVPTKEDITMEAIKETPMQADIATAMCSGCCLNKAR